MYNVMTENIAKVMHVSTEGSHCNSNSKFLDFYMTFPIRYN